MCELIDLHFVYMALKSGCIKLKWIQTFVSTSHIDFLTNQIWHLVQWFIGNTWQWPEPYNTDKGQIWLFEIFDERLSLWKVSYEKWV